MTNPLAYISDHSMRKHWATKDPEDVRSWQAARLRRYLRDTVLPFSEYYGGLEIDAEELRSLDDLQRWSRMDG